MFSVNAYRHDVYSAPPGHARAILDDVELSPFRIERFYARYEHSTRFMLSSSDCESRTIGALLELEPDAHGRLLETWCGYTESPGGPGLRQAIASLYERTGAEEVVVTSCAEEGIFLLYHALLRPGDHVIVETPCYESALQLARSTGADVSQWRRRHEDGWAHDLDALARLIRPETRMLYLNQPHNPTGTLMARPVFEQPENCSALTLLCGLYFFSFQIYADFAGYSEKGTRKIDHNASECYIRCDVVLIGVRADDADSSCFLRRLKHA